MVKLSVIIPTLNEEKYIGKCLQSLKNQTFRDFEVIVADTVSKDRTAGIAKKYGARVVSTTKKGPAAGRNAGAEKAKGEILVFTNADAVLSRNVLKSIVEKTSNKKIVGGVCSFYPLNGRFFDKVFFKFGNWISRASMKMNFTYSPGECLFVKKPVFQKIGGFREDLVFNEDNDLANSCFNFGKFIYLKARVDISLRRYKKYGYFKTFKTYIAPTVFYMRTNQVPSTMFELEAIR
ncbi:MAG TPA: glycosyltransferase [archaeon]|nr:glycosyltransferase [archaeon]